MLERLSIACSTSGGTDTFSTMKLAISRPYFALIDRIDQRQQRLAELACSASRRRAPASSPSPARRLNTLTMRERIVSANSSSRKF